jgi:phage terminase small subunit
MSAMQEKFVESYCLTGNATKAALMAGYSENTAKQKGYELKNKLSKEIADRTGKLISDMLPSALNELRFLMEEATSESVKLGAIKDILDRSGLKPVEKTEVTTVEKMSTEEIQRELDAILGTRH